MFVFSVLDIMTSAIPSCLSCDW